MVGEYEQKPKAFRTNGQVSANLDVIEALLEAGVALLLLSLRLSFAVVDVSEVCSPSSSFSLSFSSCNTST